MAPAVRFLRLLPGQLARRWREALAAVWFGWGTISVFASGGPVAYMPYTLIWLGVGLAGWLSVRRWAPPPARRSRASRPPEGEPAP